MSRVIVIFIIVVWFPFARLVSVRLSILRLPHATSGAYVHGTG